MSVSSGALACPIIKLTSGPAGGRFPLPERDFVVYHLEHPRRDAC
jgi:hypothetical protein